MPGGPVENETAHNSHGFDKPIARLPFPDTDWNAAEIHPLFSGAMRFPVAHLNLHFPLLPDKFFGKAVPMVRTSF
jgi:hypothetical protein